LIQERVELDPLVTAHTWVRRPAPGINRAKVADDCVLESFGVIENIERDVQYICHPACVLGCSEVATARRVVDSFPAPQLEHDARDVVTVLFE
jgi:hypothetical protein